MSPEDEAILAEAQRLLDHSSLASRLTNLLGRQLDVASQVLPEKARSAAAQATTLALRAAFRVALRSLQGRTATARTRALHKALATASGAAGGAFGFAALPIELPASTVVMLRAIADIAKAEGEDLHDPQVALACLEVFALGSRTPSDGGLEGGYFAVRGLLARTVSEAARYMVGRGVVDETAPILVRFLGMIASRFGVVVTQKVAAQAIPALGALGGAAVNYAFVDHFQSIARGHFIVRRLERAYGPAVVRAAFERLRRQNGASSATSKAPVPNFA
jgi:hypothetical protein